MDQQQVRTWYVDSRHCTESDDGSLQLNLYENVEINAGTVCCIDDLSLSGTTPNVAANTRLYLYEWTPQTWNFTGTAIAHSPLDPNRNQTVAVTIETHTHLLPLYHTPTRLCSVT